MLPPSPGPSARSAMSIACGCNMWALNGRLIPQEIASGDYVQAIYSRDGHNGIGSWLLVTSDAGRAANILRLDVTPGAFTIPTHLRQAS